MTETGRTGALPGLVRHLAEVRQELAAVTADVAAQTARFETENSGILTQAAKLKAVVQQTEDEVRRLALGEYERTGEKHPAPGLTIRSGVRLEYAEPDAIAWARSHEEAAEFLKLDRVWFERAAQAMSLPFVTKVPAPSVTIARDLGTALAAEEVPHAR